MIQTALSGKQDTCEFRIIAKNGDVHWNADYNRPEWDESEQRVVRIYGAGQDITARKQVEEALRASEAKSQALVHAIPDMMVRLERIPLEFMVERDILIV